MVARRLIPFLVPAAIALALAGCGGTPATAPTSPFPTTPATPVPTPTSGVETAPLPDGALFRITTEVSLDEGGALVLTETVWPGEKPSAAVAKQLDDECGDWREGLAEPGVMRAEITHTSVGDSVPIDPDAFGVDAGGDAVFTGDASTFMASCATALTELGDATGWHPVDLAAGGGSGVGSAAVYGFANAAVDPSVTEWAAGVDRITLCTVELGAVAQGDPVAAAWPSTDQDSPGLECRFGGDD
jgi:hypothetical protein